MERTLSWFLKNRIFGGIQKLKKKEYIIFTVIILLITSINTILAILFHLNLFPGLEFIQTMLILEMFIAFAIIISGVLIGKIKNFILYIIIFGIVMIFFGFAYFSLEWTYSQATFTVFKVIFFFAWILISSISLFFLIMYFFTSFPKKVITLGMPKDHIFFGPILKLVAWISIPLYIYMIIQGDPSSIIFGIFGLINAIIVLRLMWKAPKKVEKRPGMVNFATAVGSFNMFVFYHLIMSFTYAGENAFSLVLEIVILLIGVLYLVQTLTRRISESPDRPIPFENPVQFQSRIYFTSKMKKIFGERGLVIVVLGLALGYHMVYLDAFFIGDVFISEIPILNTFVNPNLKISDLYHRFYLLVSFFIILIAWFTFKSSKRFKGFMVDKFTLQQVLRYIGGFFTATEDGVTPFEVSAQAVGKRIREEIKNLGDKWQNMLKDKNKPE